MVCLTVGLALGVAAVQLPAARCIVTSAPSEMACSPDCCAKMGCCESSTDRSAPEAPPLAKTGQKNISAMPAMAVLALAMPFAAASHVFSSATGRAHSPPPLALICIRLI